MLLRYFAGLQNLLRDDSSLLGLSPRMQAMQAQQGLLKEGTNPSLLSYRNQIGLYNTGMQTSPRRLIVPTQVSIRWWYFFLLWLSAGCERLPTRIRMVAKNIRWNANCSFTLHLHKTRIEALSRFDITIISVCKIVHGRRNEWRNCD